MSDNLNQKLADYGKPYWIFGPLIFSGFYFLPIVFSFEKFTTTDIIISIIIYLTFLALYAKAVFSCGEKVLLPLVAIVVLCIAGTAVTPGTQALFGFVSYFLGFNFTLKKAVFGLVMLIASIFLSAFLFNFYDAYFVTPAVIISVALIFFGRAERKNRIHQQKEKLSQEKIEQLAAIAERERIARDLHDLIGHSLTSIALKADLAEKLACANKMPQAKQEISAVAQLSRVVLSEVREAVSGLKYQQLNAHLQTLKEALEQQQFSVKINNELPRIASELEANLVLIFKEAITNILKHSNGNAVALTLTQQDNKILLTISDNGQVNTFKFGNGLNGMTERCQHFNGSLTTNHQHGFTLNIILATKTTVDITAETTSETIND